jgi:putative heme-binding domain-containing protein
MLNQRIAAIRALAESRSPDAAAQLLPLTSDPAVRTEALLALAQLADRRALAAYLEGLIDKDEKVRAACKAVVIQLREAVADDIAALGRRSELSLEVRRELASAYASSALLRGKNARLAFLKEDVPDHLNLAIFRKHALEHGGDAQRGAGLFFDSHGIGCVKCHNVGEQGGAKMGPNLAGVGAKYPREELIRSLLQPSARILAGYELTIITTGEGQVLQGAVQSETDALVKLIDESGNVTEIAKRNIDQRSQSLVSPMPNGLERGMAREDFADIVAFLESLKDTSSK